jgi:hypothetical protein
VTTLAAAFRASPGRANRILVVENFVEELKRRAPSK